MQIINLKDKQEYIEQYVFLRNKYRPLLLTKSVTVEETKNWLSKEDVIVLALIENDLLLGAVILYLAKGGEIAFFAREKNKGTGQLLIDIIEQEAKERQVSLVWAWVLADNLIAQRVFEKKGYIKEESSQREYKGEIKLGYKYIKYLKYQI